MVVKEDEAEEGGNSRLETNEKRVARSRITLKKYTNTKMIARSIAKYKWLR
jgi:hypothetical protein